MSNNPYNKQPAAEEANAPPPYSKNTRYGETQAQPQDHLAVPGRPMSDYNTSDEEGEGEGSNGINQDVRRSMEMDVAPLPEGWRREYDAK